MLCVFFSACIFFSFSSIHFRLEGWIFQITLQLSRCDHCVRFWFVLFFFSSHCCSCHYLFYGAKFLGCFRQCNLEMIYFLTVPKSKDKKKHTQKSERNNDNNWSRFLDLMFWLWCEISVEGKDIVVWAVNGRRIPLSLSLCAFLAGSVHRSECYAAYNSFTIS